MTENLDEFKSRLGSPFYEDEDVLIYHGDCVDIMKLMPSSSIPLTVTSPPYNIGKEYEKVMDLEEYLKWTEDWIDSVYNLTSSKGSFWLNLGYIKMYGTAKAIPLPYLIWNRVPFFLIQEIVWNYGAGVAGRKFFSPRNEKFLWYVKDEDEYVFNLDDVRDPNVKYPNQKKNGKLKCNPLGKNPTDVWQIAKVTSGRDRSSKERTAHPAQFPIELIRRILLASSNKGQIIFDPFLGSGSTAIAALYEKRKVIGIEMNKDYADIAVERIIHTRSEIKKAKSQQSLFDLPVGKKSNQLETR